MVGPHTKRDRFYFIHSFVCLFINLPWIFHFVIRLYKMEHIDIPLVTGWMYALYRAESQAKAAVRQAVQRRQRWRRQSSDKQTTATATTSAEPWASLPVTIRVYRRSLHRTHTHTHTLLLHLRRRHRADKTVTCNHHYRSLVASLEFQWRTPQPRLRTAVMPLPQHSRAHCPTGDLQEQPSTSVSER